MIKSKEDYYYYVKCDEVAMNFKKSLRTYLSNPIWRFEHILRKTEYYHNCRKDILGRIFYRIHQYRFLRLSVELGFTIPLNVFGPGLSIAHYGNVVVNSGSKVGSNCRIHVGVNIGAQAGKGAAPPLIGNNVYIGPGAKLYGSIIIGNNIAIGANAVVNKSFEEDDITIAGIPAKKISDKGSNGLLIKSTEIVTSIH